MTSSQSATTTRPHSHKPEDNGNNNNQQPLQRQRKRRGEREGDVNCAGLNEAQRSGRTQQRAQREGERDFNFANVLRQQQSQIEKQSRAATEFSKFQHRSLEHQNGQTSKKRKLLNSPTQLMDSVPVPGANVEDGALPVYMYR